MGGDSYLAIRETEGRERRWVADFGYPYAARSNSSTCLSAGTVHCVVATHQDAP